MLVSTVFCIHVCVLCKQTILPSLVEIFCRICGFYKSLALRKSGKKECQGSSQLHRLWSETQCGIAKTGCFGSTIHIIRITLSLLTSNSTAAHVLSVHIPGRFYIKLLLDCTHLPEYGILIMNNGRQHWYCHQRNASWAYQLPTQRFLHIICYVVTKMLSTKAQDLEKSLTSNFPCSFKGSRPGLCHYSCAK